MTFFVFREVKSHGWTFYDLINVKQDTLKERCPSGCRSALGKRVYAHKVYRGFESLSLRHFKTGLPVKLSGSLLMG